MTTFPPTLLALFDQINARLDEAAAERTRRHARWRGLLEAAIREDPDLTARYVPQGPAATARAKKLPFEPHNASEYARLAATIKEELRRGESFLIERFKEKTYWDAWWSEEIFTCYVQTWKGGGADVIVN